MTWTSWCARCGKGTVAGLQQAQEPEAPKRLASHRARHPPRLPSPVLDPVARFPRLAAHEKPVPAPQLADRLPDLHVVDVDAVVSERFAQVERLAGVKRVVGSPRCGKRAGGYAELVAA